jgi:hypothetical protein
MQDLQSLLPPQFLQLIPMVVALVALVRNRLPQVDGHEIVLGVSAAISIGLCFLVGGDTPAQLLKYGIMVALATTGGMQALKYHATKSGGTLVSGTLEATSIPPPPKVPSIGVERGFARVGVLMWAAFAGTIAALAFPAACSGVSKQDVKTVVDIAKDLIEEVCTPEDRSLDACLDKVLSSKQYARATRQFPRETLDGGAR